MCATTVISPRCFKASASARIPSECTPSSFVTRILYMGTNEYSSRARPRRDYALRDLCLRCIGSEWHEQHSRSSGQGGTRQERCRVAQSFVKQAKNKAGQQ